MVGVTECVAAIFYLLPRDCYRCSSVLRFTPLASSSVFHNYFNVKQQTGSSRMMKAARGRCAPRPARRDGGGCMGEASRQGLADLAITAKLHFWVVCGAAGAR